jgi:molybdopterin/thiamine biosynthesis adenylyltransferase
MQTWPERYPGRLEYELEQFARRGLDFDLDEELLADQGRVVLRGSIDYQGKDVELEVRYPDLYPFVRPEVIAPGLTLERHQNPYEGNLCLLDRSTRAWKPSFDGSWLVAEKVPYLLALLEAGEEAMRGAETPQGEPLSSYFPAGGGGTAVFVPEQMRALPADAKFGSGRIRAFGTTGVRLRGTIAELVEKRPSRKTKHLARAEETVLQRFPGMEISFRWARLERLPPENTPAALLAAIDASRSGFGSPPRHRVADGTIAVSAAVFAEEVGQDRYEDSWLFAVQFEADNGQRGIYLIRGERLGRADLELRLPAYVRLGERRVALAGLGALGGPLALELARAGLGQLRGLDFDEVEVGNGVRWPAGITAVGAPKAAFLANFIHMEYPYTSFEPFPMLIGNSAITPVAREESEIDQIERFLADSDLLIEATAEIGIQQALAASADERGLAQLYVSATEGAHGGLVARVVPGAGGCWMCLQAGIDDGSIPLPGLDEPLTLQPQGCNSLTYTAAGFDLTPIVAQAARVVASTLAEEPDDAGSVAFVCELDRRLAPPRWSTHPISTRPECPVCGGETT